MKTRLSLTQRRALFALAGAVAIVGTIDPAMAQALEPVVKASTIVRDTVAGICLLLMTAGWGIAGFKIMFAGANFRDVSNMIIGGAISGGAAAMAAVFIAA